MDTPHTMFIGFTGTPADKVVLDLRYEARRVDQNITTSQEKIDNWFEERTQGLTDVAKTELKRRWGTMQSLLSSRSRLEKVVFDILDDFYKDLKKYEPAMRVLIDRYITAKESEKLSAFDDMTLVDLIVQKGEDALGELPEAIKQSQSAMAETIENNVHKLIIDEMPTNPKYYLRMSELLDALVKKRKQADVEYKEYLKQVVALSKKVKNPMDETVGAEINTSAKRALYDNLGQDVTKALVVNETVLGARQSDWRGNHLKERAIRIKIKKALPDIADEELKNLFEIIKNQNEY